MNCQDCAHYLPSIEANKPRWGLNYAGFCKVGVDIFQRSRLILLPSTCWLNPPRWEKRK